jgi:hypothetical protein
MADLRASLRRVAPALVAVAAVSACSDGPVTRTEVGVVVDVSAQRVCLDEVGAPLPRCYASEPALSDGVAIGDCVQVTATLHFGRIITREATAIEPVAAADEPVACAAP